MNNRITIDDATYAYSVQGKGDVLVLFHGFTGSRKTWKHFVSLWSKHFTVMTIDLPGHGETICKTPRTMEHFCADFKQILTKLQIETCHLLGYSLGGRTALSFAMYYPKCVQSLILESASPGLRTEKERTIRRKNDERLAMRIKREGLHSFVSFWENIPLFETQKQLPQNVREKIREERLNQSEEGLAASLLQMGTGAQPSWWSKLEQLTIPTFLIAGENDSKFVRINETMEKMMPFAQLSIIKNAGHAVHVEQVEIFAKIVMEFLNKK